MDGNYFIKKLVKNYSPYSTPPKRYKGKIPKTMCHF